MNLLEETKDVLKGLGKSPEDVLWCAIRRSEYFSWDDFAKVADFEYDDGFGAQEITGYLEIVFDDCWIRRTEYDGSEEWELLIYPEKPEKRIVPTKENLLE